MKAEGIIQANGNRLDVSKFLLKPTAKEFIEDSSDVAQVSKGPKAAGNSSLECQSFMQGQRARESNQPSTCSPEVYKRKGRFERL